MRELFVWSQAHPVRVLAILLACAAASFANLKKLRVDTSPEMMMVKGDPAKAIHDETVERFGSEDITVVFVRDADLFTPETLAALEKLAHDLEDVPGILKCESLFSVSNIKHEDGALNTNLVMDWVPETLEEARQVRANALSNDILVRNLISESGDATAINLSIESRPDEPNFITGISDKIDEVLKRYEGKFDTLFQIGQPYNVRSQERTMNADMERLAPLSALVIVSLLILTMRSLSAAILPMLTAGLSIFLTFGFMAFAGLPVTVLTVIVPSLLLVVGSTEDVHILSEYLEGFKEHQTRSEAIHYMANKVGTAVMLTAFTTVFGFLSIAANEITLLRQFGMTASFGLLVNPLVTCLLAPVYLRYFGPKRAKERHSRGIDSLLDAVSAFLLALTQNHRRAVLVCLLGTAVVFAYWGLGVKVDSNTLGFFKKDAPIVKRFKTLSESMAGSASFYVRVTGKPGDFTKPQNLAYVDQFQTYMERQGWFDKTISFTNFLKLIHREMNDGDPAYDRIPDQANTVDEYLLFLNREDIEKYVTSDFDDLTILVRHSVHSSWELKRIHARLREQAREIFPPQLSVVLTGEGILTANGVDTIAAGLVLGIFMVSGVIFVIMTLLFTNLRAGALSLIPNLFPLALTFGIMALFEIPINTGTCMIFAISLGIAVDDTIHMMSRYNKEMRQLQDTRGALAVCIRSELLPVASTSIALGIGFAVLGFSSFVPIMQFGILSALVMLFAFASDMLITPVLLSYTQLVTLWDMAGLRLDSKVVTDSKLFANMRAWQIKKVILLGKMGEIPSGGLAVVQGDPGKTMFLILEGDATVFVTRDSREVELATLGPGDFFGEIALVNPGPRSASVRAESPIRYIELDGDGLDRIARFYPWLAAKLFQNISNVLGQRLATADEFIAAAGNE